MSLILINKKLVTRLLFWLLIGLPISVQATVYEDAEDGDINGNIPNLRGWFVYDNTPEGAQILNVYDAIKQSRVIQFSGSNDINNGYVIGNWNPSLAGNWNNTQEFHVNFCARYNNYFVIYMRVYTDKDVQYPAGSNTLIKQRYIYYTPLNVSYGASSTYPSYIHHGLGTDKTDDQWHSIHLDLQADLTDSEPGTTITSVVAFLSRGNGKIDDLQLTTAPPQPEIKLKKIVQTVFDPVNGQTNPKAIPGAVMEYTLTAQNVGFKAADNNTTVIQDNIPNNMRLCVANIGACKKPYLVSSSNTSGMGIGSILYQVNGTFVANPPADAQGFNQSVTAIKIAMTGEFPDVCSGPHQFDIKFRTGLK